MSDNTDKSMTISVKSHDGVTETITIPVEEYQHLIDRVSFLDCLESAGVDNWNGYGEAQEMYNGDSEEGTDGH
ncbi:hypothetical protein [Bacillus phage SPO1L3]|nr:hypothetical protein Goe10_c01140 [Bacillus phage vB_BsuM-Goe10]WIT26245.1 hypothetical protein [Bacillus phage SPO1L3]WIT26642.1 hypothetical protein [Bacillus phage SPO1L5]